ncbi:MAG: glycosyltransferase family 4 protein [Candidatus Hydrogenedentes bacterium]|nr:glycosyltransferase family 4 protein [Candidatus Hydrogenedentota bacterium]
MRILFANNLCGHYGGVEQTIAHTARALAAKGHECHLAYASAGRNPEEFARLFASVTRCREFGGPPQQAGGQLFADIIARCKPDVLFVHKISQLPEGVEHARNYRKIVLVHDNDMWCPTGLGYDRRTRKLCTHSAGWQCYLSFAFLEKRESKLMPFRIVSVREKICEMQRYHQFDSILANSNFIREKLLANGFPFDRTRVCHPALNQPEPAPSPVPDESVILYVGSLIRGKGVDLLLEALPHLRCPYQLYIVGVGKSQDALKRKARDLGIAGAVHFEGWIPNEKIAGYYQRARVVAVPSAWPEPFGLVGLEAMRHGRPVVAFRTGGIPDWLVNEENGLLAPSLDVAAYAAALERALAEPGLAKRLGENGARRAREKFSFEKYLNRLEQFLAGAGVADEPA